MQSTYNGLELPKNGRPIAYADGKFDVPDNPITVSYTHLTLPTNREV